jgi:UDP:flavonoid glycosyltransferase YjiC (YdhE family)
MRITAICRGAPGLGRVVPSLALIETLAARGNVTSTFMTYGAGARYLTSRGKTVVDLGEPDGLFIDSVAPQALRILELLTHDAPDAILVDGEFFLPVALTDIGAPVIYLANPHDLLGAQNTFRRVNRILLSYADMVIMSSLSCARPNPRPALVRGTPCIEIPPLTKDVPLEHRRADGAPRVLVTTGGGSLRNEDLRVSTDTALAQILDVLTDLVDSDEVASVRVVLGCDARLPDRWQNVPTWLEISDTPVELADLYPDHDLLIARAGRNTTAEAAYCGIPTVLLPMIADAHRAVEQTDNVSVAAHRPGVFPLLEWSEPVALRKTLTHALAYTRRGVRTPGQRGNDTAADTVARLLGYGYAPPIECVLTRSSPP